jgi:hypothetical protein
MRKLSKKLIYEHSEYVSYSSMLLFLNLCALAVTVLFTYFVYSNNFERQMEGMVRGLLGVGWGEGQDGGLSG